MMHKLLFLCILTATAFAQESKPFFGAALATNHDGERKAITVFKLVPGSGADEAGLKEKDQIIAIDGKNIVSLRDIDGTLDHLSPGDKVTVKVKRRRKLLTFQVTLTETPPVAERLAPIVGEKIAGIFSMGHFWFGFEGIDMSSQLATNMNAPQGILVNKVFEDGPAMQAGLFPGDIVFQVSGKAIQNKKALGEALSTYKEGSEVELKILREGQAMSLRMALISLGDVPDKYRTDLQNYLNLNLNNLIQGAIELGESFENDQD